MTTPLHHRLVSWMRACGLAGLLLLQPACRTVAPAPSLSGTTHGTSRRAPVASATADRVPTAGTPVTVEQADEVTPSGVYLGQATSTDASSADTSMSHVEDLERRDALATNPAPSDSTDSEIQQVVYDPPTLPPEAYRGRAGTNFGSLSDCPPEHEGIGPTGPWQPDGLYGPWPYDEYIFDGGDRDVPVVVDRDWTVRGIDQEDTIAHYDTLQGRTEVTPSNRVPIYSPRFASVRKVTGLEYHEAHERIAGVENPVRLQSQDANRVVTTKVQPTQPVLQHAFRSSVALRDQTRGIGIENAQLLLGLSDVFLPYEDFRIIKRGEFDVNEKLRLAERVQAAIVWSRDQSVQVVIEGSQAYEGTGSNKAGETLQYEMPPGKPRLRIVKVASTSEALPGEEVDFTLRFDNIGDQRIGNVTIIDSLTTRLEYVPESAQCDLPARFATVDNEAESLLLRWEIRDPLDVGQGGIIRFKCKVR